MSGMHAELERVMDAYCVQCGDVHPHHLLDEGSCECTVCGHVEMLVCPLPD